MEVPGPKSALSEGSGVGVIGDSLSEDFAIKRSDLADRVRIMKNTVEQIADDLNRSKTGLIYIVNNICLKMIRK